MSAAEIRESSGWWPNLVRAVCDECGWRGPVRDVYRGGTERTLARLDRDQHACGEVTRRADRAGAQQRHREVCEEDQQRLVSWQRRAEAAEGWLSELADVLDMQGAGPAALLRRVQELTDSSGGPGGAS